MNRIKTMIKNESPLGSPVTLRALLQAQWMGCLRSVSLQDN